MSTTQGFNIDKEWLYKRYVIERAPVKEIAEEAFCSVHTIKKRLVKWGFKRGKFGQKAWNKGLTKETSEGVSRIAKSKTGNKNPMFGKDPWNKGLTKETSPIVKIVSEKLVGLTVSDKTREKMASRKRGKRGAEANNWKGDKGYVTALGYLQKNLGYEHRLIAESYLGRALATQEHVHHFDKNKLNNAPSNLMVLPISAHLKLHAHLKKLKRIPSPAYQQLWLLMNDEPYELVEK